MLAASSGGVYDFFLSPPETFKFTLFVTKICATIVIQYYSIN